MDLSIDVLEYEGNPAQGDAADSEENVFVISLTRKFLDWHLHFLLL